MCSHCLSQVVNKNETTSILVDNLGQAVRTQLVDGLLVDQPRSQGYLQLAASPGYEVVGRLAARGDIFARVRLWIQIIIAQLKIEEIDSWRIH